jgi:hypothetical protein
MHCTNDAELLLVCMRNALYFTSVKLSSGVPSALVSLILLVSSPVDSVSASALYIDSNSMCRYR